MRVLPAALLMLLVACSPVAETTRRAAPDLALPPMNTFAQSTPTLPRVPNAVIARDFLDLVFRLENGDEVPVFSRFEGPVTVGVRGAAPATLEGDLERLIGRLRREAGIDIRRAADGGPASITVEAIPRASIQRFAPSAACFVRPNVSSWDEYRARRNDPATFWNRLTTRTRMAVFVPADVSPQEVRDCLHEEIAQALGPVNDLYRLTDSIFNDDNFHTVLTGYDMLILKAYHDPALESGMTRYEVASRLPSILARLNPRGGFQGIADPLPSSGAWSQAVIKATATGTARGRRTAYAEEAVTIARRDGGTDTELAFSYYLLGRLALANDPNVAFRAFEAAGRIYGSRPDTRIQAAHVALQMAAFQLSAGEAEEAIRLVDANAGPIRDSQHAALLSLMLMVKAEAMEVIGQANEAGAVRTEALAWARYGFGSEAEITDRMGEILAISPRSRQEGRPV